MSEATLDGKKGVWRTIKGRKIFIAEGQSLSEAIKISGKFKKGDRLSTDGKGVYTKKQLQAVSGQEFN